MSFNTFKDGVKTRPGLCGPKKVYKQDLVSTSYKLYFMYERILWAAYCFLLPSLVSLVPHSVTAREIFWWLPLCIQGLIMFVWALNPLWCFLFPDTKHSDCSSLAYRSNFTKQWTKGFIPQWHCRLWHHINSNLLHFKLLKLKFVLYPLPQAGVKALLSIAMEEN